MNPRTTLVLLAVALLLGGFVWFYEIGGEEARDEAERQEGLVFAGLEATDVTSVTLVDADGAVARAERRDEGWRVVEPIDFPGDAMTLDGVASTLTALSSEGEIADPQAPDVYGLGEGAPVARFRAGEQEYELLLGRKTPVGSNSYVGVDGGGTVHMVATYRLNSLQKELDELRDARVLAFDRNAIDRMTLAWPDGGVELEQREDGWWLTSPLETRASDDRVSDLLSTLSYLRADGFEDEPPPDGETGLDAPEFSAVLSGAAEEGERREVRFALGRAMPQGHRLARGQQASLYRVPEERLSELPRSVVAYRFKQLARYEVSDTQRFELVFRDPGAEPLRIDGRRDDGWKTEPEEMAAGNASGLLRELSQLDGDDILADGMGEDELAAVGLVPPRVAITVWGAAEEGGDEAVLAEVDLGVVEDDGRIVARARQGGPVYRLEAAVAENVPVSAEAFRNRFLTKEAPPDEAEEPPADMSEDPLFE